MPVALPLLISVLSFEKLPYLNLLSVLKLSVIVSNIVQQMFCSSSSLEIDLGTCLFSNISLLICWVFGAFIEGICFKVDDLICR